MFQTEVVDEINAHILCTMAFFLNHSVNEILWKNIVESGRPNKIIWRMGISWWIPKPINTRSEYVVLCFSNCNNDYTNAPQGYVTRTLYVWFGSIQTPL